MIEIIDTNGKKRNALSLKKIIHQVVNQISGSVENVDYIEAVIVGKTGREWKEWYQPDKFFDVNPNVEV